MRRYLSRQYLSFEVGDALEEFGFALLLTVSPGDLLLRELFFELGFAESGALVECLVEADLLACVAEELLAGGQAAGSPAGERVAGGDVVGVHGGSMPGGPAKGEVGSEKREKKEDAARGSLRKHKAAVREAHRERRMFTYVLDVLAISISGVRRRE